MSNSQCSIGRSIAGQQIAISGGDLPFLLQILQQGIQLVYVLVGGFALIRSTGVAGT